MSTRSQPHRRRRAIPFALAGIVIVAAATLALSAAPATAASSGVDCQILLGKTASPATPSPVLSSQCARPGQRLAAPRASTLLMVWYDGVNYGPNSTKVYGAGGPCDTGGYGISWVGASWNDRIRSYKVFNSCNYSAAWEHIDWRGYCIERYGQVPNAGVLAGEISSFWVASGSWPWTLCDPGN
jgi:hypothetical protein